MRLQEEFRGRPFEIVLVNIMESKVTVTQFLNEQGYDFTVLMDSTGEVTRQYYVQSHPTTYLIDSSGIPIGLTMGYKEWDTPEMKAVIEKLMSRGQQI